MNKEEELEGKKIDYVVVLFTQREVKGTRGVHPALSTRERSWMRRDVDIQASLT